MILTVVLMAVAAIIILCLAKGGGKKSAPPYDDRPSMPTTPPSSPNVPSSPPSSEQAVLRFSGEIRGWLQQVAVLAEACMPNRYSPHVMFIWAMWGENEDVGLIAFTLISSGGLFDRVLGLQIDLDSSGLDMNIEGFKGNDGGLLQKCTLRTSLKHQVIGLQKFLGIDSALEQKAKQEGSIDLCSPDYCKLLNPIRQEMVGRLHDSRDIKFTQAMLGWEEDVEGFALQIHFEFD